MGETRLNVRVDPALKSEAEEVYGQLGMTLATAVNVFLRQSVREGGMPFQPSLNAGTAQALDEAARGDVESFDNVEEWWTSINED